MANLITNHDPYHIHKLLGLASLLNYLLRLYYLFSYGTAFPSHEPFSQAVCCVLVHGILSTSSLLLPLPLKRNFASPMIWPEFRLHSITFALRHVIATVLTLSNAWPPQKGAEALMKLGLIILTIECASWITERFGDHEKRTTNSMPYPPWITQNMQKDVKDMYTRAQFGATKAIVFSDPTLSYFPLLGIQMAPLLMTLVRKGKINSINYHRIYAISLAMSYIALFVRLHVQPDKIIIVSLAFTSLFPLISLRRNGISRAMIWVFYVTVHFAVVPTLILYFGVSAVVLACAITTLASGTHISNGSLKFRVFWVLFVVLGLTIRQVCFGTDLEFEETNVDPYILKIVPLLVMLPILQQIRAYGCLFVDRNKLSIINMISSINTSTTVPDKNEAYSPEPPESRKCNFLNS